ncbi:MAG: hypothetical protein IPL32_16875 [Chloracidobacterium sp.]|nr:hypothetical protein [Chloracidobacterium sp.]
MLLSVSAYGASSRLGFLDSTAQFFGLQSSVAPIFSGAQSAIPANTITITTRSAGSALAGNTVAVSLPVINATPGPISIPITVGDVTGLGVISYDLQMDFNPAVLTPAVAPVTTTGTLSSSMSITPNTSNAGHIIISAFQGASVIGSGNTAYPQLQCCGYAGTIEQSCFQ